MSTKAKVITRLKNIGVTDYDIRFEDASVYSPKGMIWNSTDCHVFVVSTYAHPFHYDGTPITALHFWNGVIEEIEEGLRKCEDPDCDVCLNE